MQYNLTDGKWELIASLPPEQVRIGRPRKTGLRRIVNAIKYLLGNGCQWRALPDTIPLFPLSRTIFIPSRSPVYWPAYCSVCRKLPGGDCGPSCLGTGPG